MSALSKSCMCEQEIYHSVKCCGENGVAEKTTVLNRNCYQAYIDATIAVHFFRTVVQFIL